MVQKKDKDELSQPYRAEHFSFRVIPRAKFASDLASRAAGQSFVTFVERAALDKASLTDLRTGREYETAEAFKKAGALSWQQFWHESIGVAWCAVFLEQAVPLDRELEALKRFVTAHKPFFYDRTGNRLTPNRRRIDVLWDHAELLVADWERWRSVDAWKVGEKMAKLLKDAGVKAPEWGPTAEDNE